MGNETVSDAEMLNRMVFDLGIREELGLPPAGQIDDAIFYPEVISETSRYDLIVDKTDISIHEYLAVRTMFEEFTESGDSDPSRQFVNIKNFMCHCDECLEVNRKAERAVVHVFRKVRPF